MKATTGENKWLYTKSDHKNETSVCLYVCLSVCLCLAQLQLGAVYKTLLYSSLLDKSNSSSIVYTISKIRATKGNFTITIASCSGLFLGVLSHYVYCQRLIILGNYFEILNLATCDIV